MLHLFQEVKCHLQNVHIDSHAVLNSNPILNDGLPSALYIAVNGTLRYNSDTPLIGNLHWQIFMIQTINKRDRADELSSRPYVLLANARADG
jgi:hypothetical protein